MSYGEMCCNSSSCFSFTFLSWEWECIRRLGVNFVYKIASLQTHTHTNTHTNTHAMRNEYLWVTSVNVSKSECKNIFKKFFHCAYATTGCYVGFYRVHILHTNICMYPCVCVIFFFLFFIVYTRVKRVNLECIYPTFTLNLLY